MAPLAHPISTTTSSNFGSDPFLVVRFITAEPGEEFTDFSHRTQHPPPSIWGQRGARESGTELIFDRNSAERLVGLLGDYLRDRDRT